MSVKCGIVEGLWNLCRSFLCGSISGGLRTGGDRQQAQQTCNE